MKTKLQFLSNLIIVLIMGISMLLWSRCSDGGPKPGTRDAQIVAGKAIFDQQCISCHGNETTPATRTDLTTKAPDLSRIQERRRAANFPVEEIAKIIDGRQWVKSHGEREMPVWGEVYDSLGMTSDEIRGRKGELVAYLISIQK